MSKIEYKLQNVLLRDDQRTHDYESMYVRTFTPIIFEDDGKTFTMPARTRYGFDTYFGSLSVKKWNRYTDAENFVLHIDAEGEYEVRLTAYKNDMEYNIAERMTLETHKITGKTGEPASIKYPAGITAKADVVAFEITTISECVFYGAWYTAEIDEERIRDVRINIIMPTFKKEEFVKRNVKLLEELIESDSPIARNLTVSVIDNGRTLGQEPLSRKAAIKKYDNPNYGGAGGFARGMIEALHSDNEPTHLLVMDDDVVVSPESFERTYNLLRVVNDEYRDAFLSGAMISMQLQDKQIEDVGNIFMDGTFGAVKGFERCLSDLNHIVSNETVRFNRKRQYAAFWYCCFPLKTCRKQGLTMPFFVRGDDAEFGMRDPNRKFMTMNGICVWHMSFGHSKFNAFNEAYLAIRNMLIMRSIIPSCSVIDVYNVLFRHEIETELRKFNYGIAEMMCDAVEDYLKGPEWLSTTNPEDVLREESKKKPKSSEFTEALPAEVGKLYDPGDPLPMLDKLRMKRTHNGQVHCNDSKMINEPGIMLNEFRTYHPSKIFMHKEIWFVNDDMCTGYKTHINREKYTAITTRIEKLDADMKARGESVSRSWSEAHDTLTSEKFWIEFLGLDPNNYK